MPELQTFLQKKKDQDTAAERKCRKRARRGKTAMLSMAAVGVIPFLAPPVGTDSSVFALAAVADSTDEVEDGRIVRDALAAAMIVESNEAFRMGAGLPGSSEETYREAARLAVQELRETAGSILGEFAGKDGLHLLELDGQDGLFEDDVVMDTDARSQGTGGNGAVAGKIQMVSMDGMTGASGWLDAAANTDLNKAAGEEESADGISAAQNSTGTEALVAIGGAGARVLAALSNAGLAEGEIGTKAETASVQTGTKATAAEGETGTKATAATVQTGTKAETAAGESGTKVSAGETAVETSGAAAGGVDESVKSTPEAEAAFFQKIDTASIPASLVLKYNVKYTALKLSAEQLTVLETIVEAEAGDEDAYGKILVANVVLNRVLDPEFPDTVKEVVFQNNGTTYQFSPVRKGGRYYTVKVSSHTKAAVARALAGEDYSSGALYFFARRYTSEKKATWFDTALNKIVEYGCHEFFGNK